LNSLDDCEAVCFKADGGSGSASVLILVIVFLDASFVLSRVCNVLDCLCGVATGLQYTLNALLVNACL